MQSKRVRKHAAATEILHDHARDMTRQIEGCLVNCSRHDVTGSSNDWPVLIAAAFVYLVDIG